jgi:hypothetical protein
MGAVYQYAMKINVSFRVPMPDKEVLCIARSISEWTARHMNAEGLREWGDPGRQKSLQVRQAKAEGKAGKSRRSWRIMLE